MNDTETCSESELATLLDCTTARVRQLAVLGFTVREGRGRYLKDVSTQKYIQHLRASAAGRTNSAESNLNLPDESARLKAAQAEYYDLKNAKTRGELISADAVEAAVRTNYQMTAQKILQIPSKIAPRVAALKSAAEAEHLMHSEFVKALNNLSDEAASKLRKLGG